MIPAEAFALLDRPEFPRSRGYDPQWVFENQMGPNALWLVEWLTQSLRLTPGMRVLDLGCGRALTSIFLAREFGVRVWAADLWIGPDQNWQRVAEAGVADLVCPVRAEAHALPFAAGFFDAILSVDAYTYFGTDDLYLSYLTRFLRPGGAIGIVVPGLTRAFDGDVPAHLSEPQANGKRFWESECICFHTAEWWAEHWRRSSRLRLELADTLPDGWRHWRDFERAVELSGKGVFPSDAEALDRDGGRYIGLVRAVATCAAAAGANLYDPTLGLRAGVDQ
jgi:cyclopropane fatty-acyl-phospholipid synthase-like methyltransferase